MTSEPETLRLAGVVKKLKNQEIFLDNLTQYPEINSNNVLNTIHKTYIGLTSMLKGFQKCIA